MAYAGLICQPLLLYFRAPAHQQSSASGGAVPEHKILVREALGDEVKGVGAKLALLAALLDLLAGSSVPDQLLQLGLPLRLELPVLRYSLRLLSPVCTDTEQFRPMQMQTHPLGHSASIEQE